MIKIPNVEKVIAHLMGWFNSTDATKHPTIYQSNDPTVVMRQAIAMRDLGINGPNIDFYGDSPDFAPPTNLAAIQWMHTCELLGMEFSISIDAGEFRWSSNNHTTQLNEAIQYVRKTFFPSKAYLKWNGKPVMFEFGWHAEGIDPATIQQLNSDIVIVSQNTGVNTFAWVDFPTNYLFNYLKDVPTTGLHVPALWWGFDDHDPKNPTQSVWGGPARFINSNGGQTWLDNVNLIKNSGKQFYLAQITTWNDIQERTGIEPFIRGFYGY